MLHRRVHISQTTRDSLHGEFELEPGEGGERCEYLQEKGIDTYLVLAPKEMVNGLSGNVSDFQGHADFNVSVRPRKSSRIKSTSRKKFSLLCLNLYLPLLSQKPGTLSNRNSKQLINTTATNGNAASPQSTSTESKQEVNYDVWASE